MTSDPYAAGYRFARSALTGDPTRDQKAVCTIYIYIYIYIYTDSEIIVLTRWGSLRLAPITILKLKFSLLSYTSVTYLLLQILMEMSKYDIVELDSVVFFNVSSGGRC